MMANNQLCLVLANNGWFVQDPRWIYASQGFLEIVRPGKSDGGAACHQITSFLDNMFILFLS